MNFFTKYSNQITGYLFITPAVLLISLFGIFPVFFGFYMSFHKWKVFKGRFLGFENYNRILGDISSFWIFVLGLLCLIFSYWLWSEYKDKLKNKIPLTILRIAAVVGERDRSNQIIPICVNKALKNETINVNEKSSRDYIHIFDLVEFLIRAIKKNRNDIVNIGSGEKISAEKIIKKIIKL